MYNHLQNYYFLISNEAPASIKLLKPASKVLPVQLKAAASEKHLTWIPRSHRNHISTALPWLSFSWLSFTVVNNMHLRNIRSIHLNLSSPTTKVYQYARKTETKYAENLRREVLSICMSSYKHPNWLWKKRNTSYQSRSKRGSKIPPRNTKVQSRTESQMGQES